MSKKYVRYANYNLQRFCLFDFNLHIFEMIGFDEILSSWFIWYIIYTYMLCIPNLFFLEPLTYFMTSLDVSKFEFDHYVLYCLVIPTTFLNKVVKSLWWTWELGSEKYSDDMLKDYLIQVSKGYSRFVMNYAEVFH